jgi:hypothetical protein
MTWSSIAARLRVAAAVFGSRRYGRLPSSVAWVEQGGHEVPEPFDSVQHLGTGER